MLSKTFTRLIVLTDKMIEENVTDFRHLIEEKLKAKKDALDQTEAHLKKFSILREPNNAGNNHASRGLRGSIRGRLGPPTGSGGSRPSIESRLGPKISDKDQEFSYKDDEKIQEFGTETRSVMSRVVVEQQKSRDEVLAEETQKMDKKEKQV